MYRNNFMSGLSTFLLVLTLLVVTSSDYREVGSPFREDVEAGSNKVDVNFTVDPDKVKSDVENHEGKGRPFHPGRREFDKARPTKIIRPMSSWFRRSIKEG